MSKSLITTIAVMMMISSGFATATDSGAGTGQPNWLTDPEEAQLLAEETGLPVLINFTGSDWCKWCIRLQREVFTQPAFIDYASANLILVELDFPRRLPQTQEVKSRNRFYAEKYKVRGFPTIMLLEADGAVIAQTGYQQGGATKYVEHLVGLLQ